MLNFNLNPTSNGIDVSGFQSKKHHEHVNLVFILKVFKDSFTKKDLHFMPNILKNSNNKLLRHVKNHSNKLILNNLNITKKKLQKPEMLKQMKKSQMTLFHLSTHDEMRTKVAGVTLV